MPSWTDVDVFLINTFKKLTSVNDVLESFPNIHPKPKFLQDIKNQFDRRVKTFHNVTHNNRKDTRSTIPIQFRSKPLNSTQMHIIILKPRKNSSFHCANCAKITTP